MIENNKEGEPVTSTISGSEKNKISSFINRHQLLIFMVVVIILKQLLVIGLPLFAHAGAGHDDRLMINMANALINGEWLGDYSEKTLVKGLFFPLLLTINHILGIPYSIGIPGFYSLACVIFIFGIKRLFPTDFPLYLIFMALIFNPISFADETFLRVYRNSVTAAQALIVIGCMFAIYLNRFEKPWIQLLWALGAGGGLASLWHTREDGIWIIPLVMGVIVITCLSIFFNKEEQKWQKARSILISWIPIGILMLSVMIISGINYAQYGIYTTNELNNSNFTQAIKLIYAVKPNEDINRTSVPRSSVEKIYAVSPTLNSIRDQLDASLDRWSWYEKDAKVRQVEDGFFFWALREAVANSGYYENAGKANAFYQKVADELSAGFEKGELMKRPTMPSALMSPWRDAYWEALPAAFFRTMDYVVGYEAIETTMTDSIDDGKNGIQLFEEITKNPAYRQGERIRLRNQIRITILNAITVIYQLTGRLVFMVSVLAYIGISLGTLFKKWRQKYRLLDCWLVLSALILSAIVVAIGVAYTDISAYVAVSYWYLAGAYPLICVFNVMALYKMMEIIIAVGYKKRKTKR